MCANLRWEFCDLIVCNIIWLHKCNVSAIDAPEWRLYNRKTAKEATSCILTSLLPPLICVAAAENWNRLSFCSAVPTYSPSCGGVGVVVLRAFRNTRPDLDQSWWVTDNENDESVCDSSEAFDHV